MVAGGVEFSTSVADLKGFFRFYRTGYSILEVSCLQNHYGRFVEVAEYHGGAQRGGLRVPEGYRGKGWARFKREICSFFLSTAASAKRVTGHLRNGKQEPVGKTRDSRDLPAIVSQPAVHVNPLINLNKLAHVHLDPAALRPTRKTKFTWNPLNKTLRITKVEGGRRAAEWVGLRFKAQGLKKWASNVDESRTHGSSVLTSSEPQVNGCPSVDASSCSDVSDTASEPPASPRREVDGTPALISPTASTRRVVDGTPAPISPISEVWVDLAEPARNLGEMVVVETTEFSNSQFE